MTLHPAARLRSAAIATGLILGIVAVPTVAQAPALAMLDGLEAGQWEIRYRNGDAPRRLCVRNGRDLIQLKHRDTGCNRYVVEDGASEVTVQYTCKGNGYGRTNIRRESNSLVQIEAQGREGGQSFSFTAEGRRVSACG